MGATNPPCGRSPLAVEDGGPPLLLDPEGFTPWEDMKNFSCSEGP